MTEYTYNPYYEDDGAEVLASRRAALKSRSYLHKIIRDYNAIDYYPDFERWIEISSEKEVTAFYNILVTNRSLRNDIENIYYLWLNFIQF